MNSQIKDLKGIAPAFSLSLGLLIVCSGCRISQEVESKIQSKQPDQDSKRTERLELLPDQAFKRHVYDEFSREVETHFQSPQGSESVYRHADGAVKERVCRNKDEKITKHELFDKDGKTLIGGFHTRSDGSLLWKLERNSQGLLTKTTYWYDGKRVFSQETSRKDGTLEELFYRKNGKLWQRRLSKGGVESSLEQYDSSGSLSFKQEQLPDGLVLIERPASTNAEYLKLRFKVDSRYGYENWELRSVEEYKTSSMKLQRRLLFDQSGKLESSELFKADGSSSFRRLDKDGFIQSEESFDPSGKSIGVKDFTSEQSVQESFDRWRYQQRPYQDKPRSSWQNQENYPYQRNWDN